MKYIKIQKSFENNYPLTTVRITNTGKKAFEDFAGNAVRGIAMRNVNYEPTKIQEIITA